jgi:hypothetical protein
MSAKGCIFLDRLMRNQEDLIQERAYQCSILLEKCFNDNFIVDGASKEELIGLYRTVSSLEKLLYVVIDLRTEKELYERKRNV